MYDYPIYKSSQNYKSPPYIYDQNYGRGSLRKTYDFPIYKSGNMQQPKKSIVYPIHKQQGRGVGSMLKKVNPFMRKLIQKAKPKLQKVIKKASPKLRKVVKRKIAPVLKKQGKKAINKIIAGENVKDVVTKATQSSIDRIGKNVAKEIETGVDAVASDVVKKVIANPTIKKVIANPVVKKAIDADGIVIKASVPVKKSGKRSRRWVITTKAYTGRHGRLDKTIKGDGGSGNRKRVQRTQTTNRQLRKSLLKKLLKKKLMIK